MQSATNALSYLTLTSFAIEPGVGVIEERDCTYMFQARYAKPCSGKDAASEPFSKAALLTMKETENKYSFAIFADGLQDTILA